MLKNPEANLKSILDQNAAGYHADMLKAKQDKIEAAHNKVSLFIFRINL